MNDNINTIPVGVQILGRILNTKGEPVDKKAPLTNVQRVSLLNPPSGNVESEVKEGKVPEDHILATLELGNWW